MLGWGADRFVRFCEVLYGPRWRGIVAQMLCRDQRMIRYYSDGTHPIPVELVDKLIIELRSRHNAMGRMIEELDGVKEEYRPPATAA